MDEICEIVKSEKDRDMLKCGDGFIYMKDRNRDDVFYWKCELVKVLGCKGRAVTSFENGHHLLSSRTGHNHPPNAINVGKKRAAEQLRASARNTNDSPLNIVSTIRDNSSQELAVNLPSSNAQREVVRRIRRKEREREPVRLEDVALSVDYRTTISGIETGILSNFYSRINVNNDTIFLFTTTLNLRMLSNSPFWLMDGTFKTVPLIFRQLYTIHGKIEHNNVWKIVPLVYALMTSKDEESYRAIFRSLSEIG